MSEINLIGGPLDGMCMKIMHGSAIVVGVGAEDGRSQAMYAINKERTEAHFSGYRPTTQPQTGE